jgi:hypothetical protein
LDEAAIDIAKALVRLSALTIFELRGEWREPPKAVDCEYARNLDPSPAVGILMSVLPRMRGECFILATTWNAWPCSFRVASNRSSFFQGAGCLRSLRAM